MSTAGTPVFPVGVGTPLPGTVIVPGTPMSFDLCERPTFQQPPISPHRAAMYQPLARTLILCGTMEEARQVAKSSGLPVSSMSGDTILVRTINQGVQGMRFHTIIVTSEAERLIYDRHDGDFTRILSPFERSLAPGGKMIRL